MVQSSFVKQTVKDMGARQLGSGVILHPKGKRGKRKNLTQNAESFEKVHPKSDTKRKSDLPDFGLQKAKKRFVSYLLNIML